MESVAEEDSGRISASDAGEPSERAEEPSDEIVESPVDLKVGDPSAPKESPGESKAQQESRKKDEEKEEEMNNNNNGEEEEEKEESTSVDDSSEKLVSDAPDSEKPESEVQSPHNSENDKGFGNILKDPQKTLKGTNESEGLEESSMGEGGESVKEVDVEKSENPKKRGVSLEKDEVVEMEEDDIIMEMKGGENEVIDIDKDEEAESSQEKKEKAPGEESHKKISGEEDSSIIEISSVTSSVNAEDISEERGTIKISTIESLTQTEESDKDDTVEIIQESIKKVSSEDNENSNSSVSSTPSESKKSGIKLASFAGLGRNGITDQTPISNNNKSSGCHQCSKEIGAIFNAIVWETMQFCDEKCLANYQNVLNNCSSCKKTVDTTSVGKYCVRFGSDIKQFCSSLCLEDYKKGLKVCCYCQKDISSGEGFLAPIGGKGQFKDFCLQACLKRYEVMHLGKSLEKQILPCAVCSEEKTVEVELLTRDLSLQETKIIKLCSNPCFSAFKFANTIETSRCDLCSMPYDVKCSSQVIYYDGLCKRFCSVPCQNVYVMKYRKIVPCAWCKVKKYNFDMIEKWTSSEMGASSVYCSINCLNLHSISHNSVVSKTTPSTWNGNRGSTTTNSGNGGNGAMPVIQSVSSLAGAGEPPPVPDRLPTEPVPPSQLPVIQTIKETLKEVIVKCPKDVEMRNKGTLTKPYMQTKGVSCRPHTCHKSSQTDGPSVPALFPITVPMYMPMPMRMYSTPYPVPIPIPIPVPVPVFIPTTRNSTRGIMKQIKKIQAKLPADPFEAELLAMAGALVDKKPENNEDSDDSVDEPSQDEEHNDNYADTVPPDTSSDPVTNLHPAEDLENEIAADKVVPKPLPTPTIDPSQHLPGYANLNYAAGRGRSGRPPYLGQKRRASNEPEEEEGWSSIQDYERNPRRQSRTSRGRPSRVKQSRLDSSVSGRDTTLAALNQAPKERPDAKHHLKFTYGVNAWKHWVVQKNAELEKGRSQGKYIKSFETDLLKLRADELNYTLCMFVKEVKKPNGDSYAPDSILYLALGIQEYFFENGRIDNIFTDQYYEPFTSALHEVVKDFKLPVNELGFFVTRIEEEHLWESKQLGCHTPQVLLNTLIYLNTKYFMLKTCDEHAKLSFSHIMKHWKKTMTPGKNNQQRTVLLRYYPPAAKGQRQEDKKCYEQHENLENPARCPVKYYEQYIAKCPESTKSRNDVFYLQPERSCVADSPVWFSNSPLNTYQLDKMLQRLLMVREIQEHMLADSSS